MASAQQASSRHPIERAPGRDHGGGAALAGESSSAVCISRRRAEEQADLRRQAMRVALSPAGGGTFKESGLNG